MRGPCAKRKVVCLITRTDGKVFRGENDCANPQEVCPRAEGEDYKKCRTICQQGGHAETEALRKAWLHDYGLRGATAEVYGISWTCRRCQEQLFAAGVRWLRVFKEAI